MTNTVVIHVSFDGFVSSPHAHPVNAHLKWRYVETTSCKSFKRSMNALIVENTEEFHTGQTVSDKATACPGYESAFSCVTLLRDDTQADKKSQSINAA